ncbi:tyrosine-type recombinase/integrase [Endozoicomonas sp. ALB032]|uniref:tyrosine-type recombinase/integrase n=1 Tax=Endozoicomonas sp. ALB032 TaxID=3403082 RepID=UPI003BB504C3
MRAEPIINRKLRSDFLKSLKSHSHRAYTLTMMQLASGLRIGDLLCLEWKQLSFEDDAAYLEEIVERKRKKVQVGILFTGESFSALKELKKMYPGTEYVFGVIRKDVEKPISWQGIDRFIKRAKSEVGIEFAVSSHTNRKVVSFECWLAGMDEKDIQIAYRHSNVEQTRFYMSNQKYHRQAMARSVSIGIDGVQAHLITARDLARKDAEADRKMV